MVPISIKTYFDASFTSVRLISLSLHKINRPIPGVRHVSSFYGFNPLILRYERF